MPIWKYISNRFLTTCENLAFGHAPVRVAYRLPRLQPQVLETIPFLLNSDDFVFDSEVIAQAVAFGFRIQEVPVADALFPRSLISQLPPQRHLRPGDAERGPALSVS